MALHSKFTVIRSKDLAELQDVVSDFSSPVQLRINRKGDEIDADMALAMIGDQPFLHGTFGTARVDWQSAGESNDTMVLFVPTEGWGEITHLGRTWELTTGQGMMRDLGIEATAYQEQFYSYVLPFSKTRIREHAKSLGGDHLGLFPVEFDPVADFTTPGGQLIAQYMDFLANSLNHGLMDQNNTLVNSQARDLLLTQILTQLKSNVQDLLTGQGVSRVVPRYVKRAQEYIHANPSETLDMVSLSETAGCSYRTLQRGFVDAFGLTPRQYIRKVRLQLVRNDLMSSDGTVPIATIARRWGFAHMGRFAQEYAQEFGERPTETARQG
ncbi:helix-turn-helix transcriptional regulator [Thalassospira sp.]|uniref:AraC family transcriptional regulator n=1 Tax=Thalassospira sp. TaxID=1912094 RepID=UPI0025DD1C4A|nr:helix-turn-helix transcriptional regulator [Thalassospira sp.]